MVALGQGLSNVDLATAPAVNDFLRLQKESLQPDEPLANAKRIPLSTFHELHRATLYSMGWTWRLFGIRWESIYYLQVLFYALSMAGFFFFFMQFFPVGLSFPLTLLLLYSPLQLYAAADFRDFSKAPFVAASLALVAFLLVRRRQRPHTIAAVAGLVAVLGAGLQFRPDLVILLPLYAVLILFFYPVPFRELYGARLGIAALILCLAPISPSRPTGGTNSFHVILQGLASPFNADLALGGAAYQLLDEYSDERTHTWVSAYAQYGLGWESGPEYSSPEYDRAGRSLLLNIYRIMPADALARGVAAAMDMQQLAPFVVNRETGPHFAQGPAIGHLLEWRWRYLGWFYGRGVYFAIAALLVLLAIDIRWALAALLTLIYLGAYQNLQFNLRHFFVIEWMPWWCLGITLYVPFRTAMTFRRGSANETPTVDTPSRWMRLGVPMGVLAGIVMLCGAVWGVAILLQHRSVSALLTRYAHADRVDLNATATATEKGVPIAPVGFMDPAQATEKEKRFRTQTGMVALEMKTNDVTYDIYVRYDAPSLANRFDKRIAIPPRAYEDAAFYTVYVPLYNTTDNYFGQGSRKFAGVEVQGAEATMMQHCCAVTSLDGLAPLMTVRLPENDPGRAQLRLTPQRDRIAPLRALEAYRDNLLINGDFEAWEGSAPAGKHWVLPQLAGIEPAHGIAAHGSRSLLQHWTQSDAAGPPTSRLGLYSAPPRYREDLRIARGGIESRSRQRHNIPLAGAPVSRWEMGSPAADPGRTRGAPRSVLARIKSKICTLSHHNTAPALCGHGHGLHRLAGDNLLGCLAPGCVRGKL